MPRPRPGLEQYPTPAGIAADVAYIALAKGDLSGRRVLDLGCGNGVLAIAAALMGASEVSGVDVDPEALDVARRNARKARVDVLWRVADARDLRGTFDTILMNPPFGSQRRHADLPFVDQGLRLGRVLYSFHNAKTEAFIRRRFERLGARVTDSVRYEFPLLRSFPFHREDVKDVPVVLLRAEAAKE